MGKLKNLFAELDELNQFESEIIERVWNESPDAVDLEGTSLSTENIKARVELLADQLVQVFPKANPVLVGLMDGATPFANLLCDALNRRNYQFNYTTMVASSYGNEMVSGIVTTGNLPKVELTGKIVIVIDDVCDTGKTLKKVKERFQAEYPKAVQFMTLVDKQQDRPEGCNPDYAGFVLSKKAFIIGMGLDYLHGLRNKNSIKAANKSSLPTHEEELRLARKTEVIRLIKETAALKEEKARLQQEEKLAAPVGPNSIFSDDPGPLVLSDAVAKSLDLVVPSHH